jgi:transposase
VTAVLAGQPRRQVAQTYGMHPFALARLVQRVQQFGQIACVPHATYHRERVLRPEFQQVLRKLYTHPIRPTMMAVYEDVRLQQLADALSEQEKMRIPTPTYKQVRSTSRKGLPRKPMCRAHALVLSILHQSACRHLPLCCRFLIRHPSAR